MYPRNAASPERIALGPVIQISDGAPQSTGVTITVRGQGGAEGAGGGTTAYGATGVIVYYTPTQGETDFTSFVVIASKAGCIPVSQTIITSASATPGYGGVDWGKVTNPTTSVGLSGTTIATTQKVDVETIKTNPVVNAGTITFPTTATLASTTNITAGTITTATNLTNAPTNGDLTATMKTSVTTACTASTPTAAAVTGAVGSVTAGVTVTTNNDKTGYGLSATAVQAIWDALTAALTTAGSIGKLLVDNINATISSRSTVTTAQVNAEVVDALATDTYAEPAQGTPAATATLAAKIGYLHKAWRNRNTQTATQYSLYNDDAVTIDHKATFADDGTTADRGEIATGP